MRRGNWRRYQKGRGRQLAFRGRRCNAPNGAARNGGNRGAKATAEPFAQSASTRGGIGSRAGGDSVPYRPETRNVAQANTADARLYGVRALAASNGDSSGNSQRDIPMARPGKSAAHTSTGRGAEIPAVDSRRLFPNYYVTHMPDVLWADRR